MRATSIDKIIKIIKVIREISDIEIKDCALDSLIEDLEDMKAKAIREGEF